MPKQSDSSNKQPSDLTFPVNLSRFILILFLSCLGIQLLMVYLDFKVNYSYGTEIGALRRLCNITREDGLASWVGVTITTLTALTLWAVYIVERRLDTGKWIKLAWLILAIFFSYMAMDDGSSFHERMGTTFGEIQEREINSPEGPTSFIARFQDSFPSYNWQVVYMPIFGSLGAFTFIFLMCRYKGVRSRIFVIFAFTLMALVIGLDFIEGLEPDHKWNLYTLIADKYDMTVYTVTTFREVPYDACRHFSKAIEEFMEMLAMTILWTTFLRHLGTRASQLTITIKN